MGGLLGRTYCIIYYYIYIIYQELVFVAKA